MEGLLSMGPIVSSFSPIDLLIYSYELGKGSGTYVRSGKNSQNTTTAAEAG